MVETSTPLVELLCHRVGPTATLAAALLLPTPADCCVTARHFPLVQKYRSLGLQSEVLFLQSADSAQSSYASDELAAVERASTQHLASRLREVTGLPVSLLAKLAFVSRQTFHAWLEGGNISDVNAARLSEVIQLVETIRESRPDVARFLVSDTYAGRPIDLLIRGDVDAALGTAVAKQGSVVQTARGVVRSLGRVANRERLDDQYAAISMRSVDDSQEPLPESYIVPIGTLRIG